jgi:DNA-binding transcriptional regulator YiaG
MSDFLNQDQAAIALGVTVYKLRQWRYENCGPVYTRSKTCGRGHKVLYSREHIDQFAKWLNPSLTQKEQIRVAKLKKGKRLIDLIIDKGGVSVFSASLGVSITSVKGWYYAECYPNELSIAKINETFGSDL